MKIAKFVLINTHACLEGYTQNVRGKKYENLHHRHVFVKTCAQVRVALLLISWTISKSGKELLMSNIDSLSNPIICSFKISIQFILDRYSVFGINIHVRSDNTSLAQYRCSVQNTMINTHEMILTVTKFPKGIRIMECN